MTNELKPNPFENFTCPLPMVHKDNVVIGHGSGGRMTHTLVRSVFQKYLNSPHLRQGNDSAVLALPDAAGMLGKLAFTTDSHIVTPLFFPGGDIGRLAVCGTVNDLCTSGAIPLSLSAGFILEEGFPLEHLERILASMQSAAAEAGVEISTADTKVAEKGKVDQLFINTAGVGWVPPGRNIGGELAEPGDVVIISGALGDHGIAVLTARGDLGFETDVVSDTAPLNGMVTAILAAAPHTHVLRDPTRGGLATTLNEIASQSGVCIRLEESAIPIHPRVQTVCDMLGFDPLYVANEGKMIVITPKEEADLALLAMRSDPYGQEAAIIGRVESQPKEQVLLHTPIGGTRILDMLSGEMLPRIC